MKKCDNVRYNAGHRSYKGHHLLGCKGRICKKCSDDFAALETTNDAATFGLPPSMNTRILSLVIPIWTNVELVMRFHERLADRSEGLS
jgi:hypothetical protein